MTNDPRTPSHLVHRALQASILVSCLVASGCALLRPETPELFSDKRAYSWEDFKEDRACYVDGVMKGDEAGIRQATIAREHRLWSLIGDVDWVYDTFRTNFHGLRAVGKTAADVAKLGLAAASTVLGGSAVLSAAVVALEGSQLSVEKNFLEERTTAILLTTMDALRTERKADIQRKLAMPPPAYSFEEAYTDALALFDAGTIPSALERIAAEAGKEQRDAQEEEKEETRFRVRATLQPTTLEMVDKTERLTDIVVDLRTTGNVVKLKEILATRRLAAPADASAAELARLVQREIREARSAAELDTLVGQFKTLKIWRD